MKRFALTALALATAGCAFADPAGDPWTVDDPETTTPAVVTEPDDEPVVTDPVTDPVADPVTDPEPLSCALEASQFQETWWVEPSFNQFSPNEGLFVAAQGYDGQAITLSVSDGETYLGTDLGGLRGVDAGWGVGVFHTQGIGGSLRDLRTGEVHYATDAEIVASGVSADGRRAGFVECDGEATVARLVEVGGPTREVELDTSGPCYAWGPNRNRAQFTTDGDFLLVSTMSGRLWSIDTATLETSMTEPHAIPEEPEFYYHTIIAEMAVRPGAHEVVTTGSDGALRRWSVPGLEQLDADVEVGAFVINEMTYAPHYTVSPVAFSPDGATMAFVNVDGDIIVRNGGGDEVLPSPTPDTPNLDRAPNVPVTMNFGPSGLRLGVGYYWGPAVWGCPGGEIERRGTLEIEAPAVVELTASNSTTIPVTLHGDGPISAVRARTLDGEQYHVNYVDGGLSVWARHDQPEVETIVLEADDGFATGTATIQLRFIQ